MRVSLIGTVKNGQLVFDSPQSFRSVVLGLEGKRIEVTVGKLKKDRSNNQNRFYWGVCVPIIRQALRDTGSEFSSEQVHDLLKFKFLKEEVRVNESTGEALHRIKSTTELTTTDFMDFIANVQRWCAEFFDVVIPDPNEQLTIV